MMVFFYVFHDGSSGVPVFVIVYLMFLKVFLMIFMMVFLDVFHEGSGGVPVLVIVSLMFNNDGVLVHAKIYII